MQFPIYILIYVKQKFPCDGLHYSWATLGHETNHLAQHEDLLERMCSPPSTVTHQQHTHSVCVCVYCLQVGLEYVHFSLSLYKNAFAKCLNSLCLWYPDAFCEIEGGICICLRADVYIYVCLCIRVIIWDGRYVWAWMLICACVSDKRRANGMSLYLPVIARKCFPCVFVCVCLCVRVSAYMRLYVVC